MRYYLIAGEASGDLHGGHLIRALRERDPDSEFRAWGGDRMEAAGARLVHHIRDLAFMGFFEVARNLPTVLRLLGEAKRDVVAWKPDAVILIDYPAFNLPVAKRAHAKGLRVFWYISPQVWAWKASRVKQLKRYVERMLVILPFEPDFYRGYDMEVDYVGHPLLDALAAREPDPTFRQRHGIEEDAELVALLPGSRKQEVKRMLPVMLATAQRFPERTFVVGGLGALGEPFYSAFDRPPNVALAMDETAALQASAQAALVTSGTATLETALSGVPEVVCYKGNPLSFWIARRLVDVPHIALVNLIAGRELVPELLQGECTPDRLAIELQLLLESADYRDSMQAGYAEVRERLGGAGASARAADRLVGWLASGPSETASESPAGRR